MIRDLVQFVPRRQTDDYYLRTKIILFYNLALLKMQFTFVLFMHFFWHKFRNGDADRTSTVRYK